MSTYEEQFRDASVVARQIIAGSKSARSAERRDSERRSYVENSVEQRVRNGQVQGYVRLNGGGETTVQVAFPIKFLEKPLFTFGHELETASAAGDFPLVTPTIVDWSKILGVGAQQLWVGASLAIVVSGPSTQRSILHYSFEGRSFTNATPGDTSVTAVI